LKKAGKNAAIRLEMEGICEWPTDLDISVAQREDSWNVVIVTDGPQDAERCRTVIKEVD
jgi:hypothetical protein